MKLLTKVKNYYIRAYMLGHFPKMKNIIFPKRKIYLYVGFLGDGNYGDELVYEAAKELVDQDILIPYQHHMPIEYKFVCFFFRKYINGVIIGGGTTIGNSIYNAEYVVKLINRKKKLLIHGSGVHKIFNEELFDKLLSNNIYGGLRGPISCSNLSNIKYNVPIIGDAAFALYNKSTINRIESKSIIINWGTHEFYSELKKSREQIEIFITQYIKLGYIIYFLPLHSIDLELGEKLILKYPDIKLLNIPANYTEAIKCFNKCSFAIGERLHFNILSVLAGCCFLSINYDLKHNDFLESLELQSVGLEIPDVTYNNILTLFQNRNSNFNWDEIHNRLIQYKKMQLKSFECFNMGTVINFENE